MSSRIGALFPSLDVVYSGSVKSWDSDTFTLTVSNITGTLSADFAGLAVWRSTRRGRAVRIRSVNVSTGTVTLCETGENFTAGEAIYIYNVRLPWTRYQYIDSEGIVYKDYDISYPGGPGSLPPLTIVKHRLTPGSGDYIDTGAVWVPVNTSLQFTVSDSQAIYPSASISTYTWDVGTGGTISAGDGTDTITIAWSSSGFRYLKATVTDDQGTSSSRYVPIWVGLQCWEVLNPSLSWSMTGGWTADFDLSNTVLPLTPAPVALVDLDTWEVLFFGFTHELSSSYDPGTASHQVHAEGVLSYSQYLQAFPFRLDDDLTPSEWGESPSLTLARALAFLLHWHTNIPELVNVDAGTPSERRIKGYLFSAGAIARQIQELVGATRWVARGQRAGGFTIGANPLYEDESTWDAYTALDLSTLTDVYPGSQITWAADKSSEVRLSGVFYAPSSGSWEPVIVRAPSHPGALGTLSELTNMAPLNVDEAKLWAQRHYAVLNTSDAYSLSTHLDIDPVNYWVAHLPNKTRIAIESVSLSFSDALAWTAQASGRTYGNTPTVQQEEIPEIVQPDVPTPSINPPVIPIVDPDPEWPEHLLVLTNEHGVFETEDFDGPDGEQCTWTARSTGLPTPFATYPVYQAAYRNASGTPYHYALIGSSRDIYACSGTGDWSLLYAATAADTLTGLSGGKFLWLAIDHDNTSNFAAGFAKEDAISPGYCLLSSNAGSSWTAYELAPSPTASNNYFRAAGNLVYKNGVLYFGVGVGLIASQRVFYSTSGATWKRSNSLGGSVWRPSIYLKPGGTAEVLCAERNTDDGTAWYLQRFLSQSTLQRIESLPDGSGTYLTVDGYPHLAFSTDDPAQAALLDGSILRWTDDDWATVNTVSQSAVFEGVWMPIPSRPEWLIFAKQTGGAAALTLYVTDDRGATLTARCGPDPVAPDGNSIPAAAELCYAGLQVIE